MKAKKILACVLTSVLIFSASACGTKTEKPTTESGPIVLKIGTTMPDASPGGKVMLDVFKPKVEELSKGKIKVEVYNNAVLGGDRQILEAVQINTVQAAGAPLSVLGNFDKKFIASELPFVFKDKKTAYAALDGELGQMMAEGLDQQGMVLIGYMENSFRNISNSVRPIEKPADLKGLKIRVMEAPMYLSMFKKLGANPTPMAFNEVYTGLQQGTIEGHDNGIILNYTSKLYEVQKYYTLSGQNYAAGAIVVSKKFWDSLSEDLQNAVKEAAVKTKDVQRQMNTDAEIQMLQAMKDGGVQVTELSDEARAEFKAILVPAVWDEFKGDIGDKLYEELFKVDEKYGK